MLKPISSRYNFFILLVLFDAFIDRIDVHFSSTIISFSLPRSIYLLLFCASNYNYYQFIFTSLFWNVHSHWLVSFHGLRRYQSIQFLCYCCCCLLVTVCAKCVLHFRRVLIAFTSRVFFVLHKICMYIYEEMENFVLINPTTLFSSSEFLIYLSLALAYKPKPNWMSDVWWRDQRAKRLWYIFIGASLTNDRSQ